MKTDLADETADLKVNENADKQKPEKSKAKAKQWFVSFSVLYI